MPWPLTAATAMILWERGLRRASLMTLVMHACYLRPGEVQALRVEDLLAPGTQLHSWALVIAPQSRDEVSKTQVSDDTIFVDWPPWLGPALHVLVDKRSTDSFLFEGDFAAMRREWQAVQTQLGLRQACLYQLRHGGASGDVLCRRRSLLEVMCRGRWATDRTLRRYCKPGKLEYLMNKLSPHMREYSLWAERNIEAVIANNKAAKAPPASPGVKLPEYRASRPPASSSVLKRPVSARQC